jgi:hypothetical protein
VQQVLYAAAFAEGQHSRPAFNGQTPPKAPGESIFQGVVVAGVGQLGLALQANQRFSSHASSGTAWTQPGPEKVQQIVPQSTPSVLHRFICKGTTPFQRSQGRNNASCSVFLQAFYKIFFRKILFFKELFFRIDAHYARIAKAAYKKKSEAQLLEAPRTNHALLNEKQTYSVELFLRRRTGTCIRLPLR